jgi:hypothetical protein
VGRIAVLLDQADLGDMALPLAMEALPQTLLLPIVSSLIISLTPFGTVAGFSGFTANTAIATLLHKVQSFPREPIPALHCSIIFCQVDRDKIRSGSHRGVFVLHELQEDLPLVIP